MAIEPRTLPIRAWEYGDFQTPDALAAQVVQRLVDLGISPRSILEPTCGVGSFLLASARVFDGVRSFVGVEINGDYLDQLVARAKDEAPGLPLQVIHADFFGLNWDGVIGELEGPLLVLGNPPWVTNSALGMVHSTNLPPKSNRERQSGLDALTGKSNFDISEWMILRYIDWLKARRGTIAVLCKSSVARKVLRYVWKHRVPVSDSSMYGIDAAHYFNVNVGAVLFIMQMNQGVPTQSCAVYQSLSDQQSSHAIGPRDGLLIADIAQYEQWRHLVGNDAAYTWRSGIKHDCAAVMELERTATGFRNSAGLTVELEETYIYPLFKGSDVGNGRVTHNRKVLLVTQRHTGDDTRVIQRNAPQTWAYLQQYAQLMSKRSSSVYRARPPFSVFGIGDYTFVPWKVAISGFYKSLDFRVVGPVNGRPAVFDDTVYFLGCRSADEAEFVAGLLNSKPVSQLLESMIFWDSKRPITVDVLKRINLGAVADSLGLRQQYLRHTTPTLNKSVGSLQQLDLFDT